MEDVEVCVVLVAGLDESGNVFQDGSEVELLLFLLLALKGSFGGIDVLPSDYAFLLALVAIPSADILDSLDRSKLIVVDVDVMRDSNEGLVHVGNWEKRLPLHSLVGLADLVVEPGDVGVEEDDSDHLE